MQDVRALTGAIVASESIAGPARSTRGLSRKSEAIFACATAAAARGDAIATKDAAAKGYALIKPQTRTLLESALPFLQKQVRGIYQPAKEESK